MNLQSALTLTAIIIALIIGVRSLVQTKNIQKREQKQRLLNEIIEWAIDVYKRPFEKDFRTIVDATDINKLQLFVYEHVVAVKEGYQAMTGRIPYISEIARDFEQGLQKAVEELLKDLKAHIELLGEWQYVMADNMAADIDAYAKKADIHWRQLAESAHNVIKQATKIKLKT